MRSTFPTRAIRLLASLFVIAGLMVATNAAYDVIVAGLNKPPTAAFTWHATGLNVDLTGTATDPDGNIASQDWNFGDGATGAGPTASHTYANPGMYTITLTATDNHGAATSNQSALDLDWEVNASTTGVPTGTSLDLLTADSAPGHSSEYRYQSNADADPPAKSQAIRVAHSASPIHKAAATQYVHEQTAQRRSKPADHIAKAETRTNLEMMRATGLDREFEADGTPQLTFNESRAAHPDTNLTRDRYQRESFFKRPKCELCARFMARMFKHLEEHESGLIDDGGVRTDSRGIASKKRRLSSRYGPKL